jgi:hypothetical protein
MYSIDIEPMDKENNNELTTIRVLGTMLEVLEAVNQMDDGTFVLKMKLANNLEFLVDQIMYEYEHREQ